MDFLIEAKDLILLYLLDLLKSGWWIYVPVQAIVYIPGRMLELIKQKNYRVINSIALVFLLLFSYGYLMWIGMPEEVPKPSFNIIWLWFHWFSLGTLWYVLLGFKLYERLDKLQDKKIAPDKKKKR